MSGFLRRNLFWLGDRLHGSPIGKHFAELRTNNQDYKAGIVYQNERLEELLYHATAYSQFYNEYRGKGIHEFPVVNKAILNEYRNQLVIDGSHLPFQKGEMHIQRTSGSTGAPFAIPQDTRKRNRRIAELKYYGETVGFRSHEKLCQCRVWTKWHSKNRWQSYIENIIPFNVTKMDDAVIENLLRIVKEKKVKAVRAYASWFDAIIKYVMDTGYDLRNLKSLKVCFSGSEALDATTRAKFKDSLGIDIVECYANEEGGVIGHQKLCDANFYLNHASFLVEVLRLEDDSPVPYGELGRVVITDLFNYAFPLIRYDTGDTAIIEKGDKSSNYWPYLSKLFGRRLDLVFDAFGRPIHPMSFARILKNIPGIVQWQFVQKSADHYELRLNTNKKIDNDAVLDELKDILGTGANVAIVPVEEIPVLASGKRKSVLCEWNHQ